MEKKIICPVCGRSTFRFLIKRGVSVCLVCGTEITREEFFKQVKK